MILVLGIAMSIVLVFVERLLGCFEFCKKIPKSQHHVSADKELLIKDLMSDFKKQLYKMDLDGQYPKIRAFINSLDMSKANTNSAFYSRERVVIQLVKEAIVPSSNFGSQDTLQNGTKIK